MTEKVVSFQDVEIRGPELLSGRLEWIQSELRESLGKHSEVLVRAVGRPLHGLKRTIMQHIKIYREPENNQTKMKKMIS